jgi:hypothetical protein
MRISTDVRERDIEPAVNWISGLIGAAVDKRVLAFEQIEHKNPLLITSHFQDNFPLECALGKARKYKKKTGRLPKGNEFDLLYGFLISAQRIHAELPRAAINRFEGALRGALKDSNGLRPFAYEVGIAAHLMRKKWDVEFTDLCGTARFDFLARQDNIEIEVECKTTSGDTGRKIHRQEVNRLANLILPTMQQFADTAGCHLIRVIIPNRLAPADRELAEIASIVASSGPQKCAASDDLAQVEYRYENISAWPEPNRDRDAREFFEKLLDAKNSHIVFYSRPGHSIVAVMIGSAKADSVVDAIATQAKDAADQCSGNRPALIAMHLIDQISRPELEVLVKTQGGLQAIAHAVFKDTKRLHVDSIVFTIPQLVEIEADGARRLTAPVGIIFNDKPNYECDRLRSIFRLTSPG